MGQDHIGQDLPCLVLESWLGFSSTHCDIAQTDTNVDMDTKRHNLLNFNVDRQ